MLGASLLAATGVGLLVGGVLVVGGYLVSKKLE